MQPLTQRWASRALEQLVPADVAEALLGDLFEERAARARTAGPRRAAVWYWAQVARSIVPLSSAALRRPDSLRACAVGFVAYSVAASAEVSARDSAALVATHTAVDAVPVLIIYLGALALGAFVAERVKAGAALALGFVAALAAAVQLVAGPPGIPSWYSCAVAIAAPAAVLAGRRLATRYSRGARASRRRKTLA